MDKPKLETLFYEILERWRSCEDSLNQNWETYDDEYNLREETEKDYEEYKERFRKVIKV